MPEGINQPDLIPPCRIVAWETTLACNLACKHCRATAQSAAHPDELSFAEAVAFMDSLAALNKPPMLIITGGEPLLRADIYEIAAYAAKVGLRPVMALNGTLLDEASAQRIKDSGILRCSISLDGPDAERHDALRGVPGAFEGALKGIAALKAVGLPFQINSTVTKGNLECFKDIARLCEELGAAAWHLFLLVPAGRGAELSAEIITAEEYEKLLNWFYDLRSETSMSLKATCAPHYYRILRQRAREEGIAVTPENFGLEAMTRGCLAGAGFCFVSHTGEVQPCGYLELSCGNIRKTPFAEIWREAEVFKALRDPAAYAGKCGPCAYHRFCGGCRARALTMNGNYLAEEPLCSYRPGEKKAPPASNPENIDFTDRRLLDIIQSDFPLDPQPYARLGEELGLSEEECLARVKALKKQGVIRRLGANFDSRKLGWKSTLCGAKVPEESLAGFIEAVNALPGVTHNYLRDHAYNVWFTLIAPSEEDIARILRELTEKTGITALNLPARKVYKLKVDFEMGTDFP